MARVSGFWKKIGDTIEPAITGGASLLLRGIDRYLNFGETAGETGYGIRDNGGTLQFKNDAGTWTNFGAGGGGGGDFLADGSVPMTGDLNLNGNDINNVNSVQFDTTPTALTAAEGLLQWNATDGTLNLGMDGGAITMQIGQETFIKVRNNTGVTITNGTVVYFNSSLGNRPTIAAAQADADVTSRVQGIVTEDIIDNDDGFITTSGYVRQIKTNYSGSGIWGTTWVEGDILYVSKTNAGVLTNVEPAAPHHSDIVGTVGVVGAAGIGSILVNIDRHRTLEGLSDVNGTALATTGQIAVWNQSTGYFDFTENIFTRITRSINNVAINTAAGSVAGTDYEYNCTGTVVITLPTAVGNNNQYVITRVSGSVSIACTGAETIQGSSTAALTINGMSLTVTSNGTNWTIK